MHLIKNQIFLKAFDGILANLGEFRMGKAAEFADRWHICNASKGVFGGVDEAIARIEIVGTDVGGVVDDVLDDDRAFGQVRHGSCLSQGFAGRWNGSGSSLRRSWGLLHPIPVLPKGVLLGFFGFGLVGSGLECRRWGWGSGQRLLVPGCRR
jgi:hypothetical protein